jgi:hypothetical protein
MEYSHALRFLMDLPWVYGALIIVGAFMAFSVLGLLLTHRLVSSKTLKASHDVAGFTFGIIGLIYGVLLGFTVVEANSHFKEAEQSVIHETAILADLFRDAAVFQESDQRDVRRVLRNYAKALHEREWKSMASQEESEVAKGYYDQIWYTYKKLTPQSDKERIWYRESLAKLNDLSEERTQRLFSMTNTLGPIMWTLLLGGAIVTILFMCFFSADSRIAQILMTLCLSGTIAFMLFLIMSLEGIYAGDYHVVSTPLKNIIERFDAMLGESN